MPTVVADIVDPTSTLATSCPALLPVLDPNDASLGTSVDDERHPESMRDGQTELPTLDLALALTFSPIVPFSFFLRCRMSIRLQVMG